MAMEIVSPAFVEGGSVPARYTCDGEDVSPPLAWKGAPTGTASFALIVDDPDAPAGTWVHWVAWNIPANAAGLAEGIAKTQALPDGMRQGLSDFGRPGWGGPCPPGGTHRYFFTLYALDTALDLPAAADRASLDAAMKGHVLAKARCMGTYSRTRPR